MVLIKQYNDKNDMVFPGISSEWSQRFNNWADHQSQEHLCCQYYKEHFEMSARFLRSPKSNVRNTLHHTYTYKTHFGTNVLKWGGALYVVLPWPSSRISGNMTLSLLLCFYIFAQTLGGTQYVALKVAVPPYL